MKHILTAATALLLAMTISPSAFAHSHLSGTNPADGEVVTEPLQEIVLEFDGEIEQGSFIDVTTTSGEAIEVQDIIIGEGTLTATVAEPFPNDDYQVNWSIISVDGHPLEGEFSFKVNAPVSGTVEEEVTEEPAETTESAEETTEEQESGAAADEVEEKESPSMTVILLVLLVVIVAGGFFLLTKRKK
ncbi:copper resistance protein CopC [Sporosarcina thermotolerans]|uniref:copper resistance CopC family protein n=1 Tax=Sporosarcina thermotolerans TaxID=633404 RepID=UPI0024BD35B8|nr:copper resistance protein CopC [Sporosarcina thermotolerans]WHT49704.1 copper resistance protein CopC [Sporosarcina thermotolerans]